jgi:hypothetical protein
MRFCSQLMHGVMWLRTTVLIFGAAAICTAASAPLADVLDDIAGTYKVPATRCSTMLEEGLVSCEREVDDCLTIRKESKDSAWIQFFSVQTNGHQCADQGLARLLDGALVYCPEGEDYGGQCVRIEVTPDRLLMKRVGSEGKRDAFCGSRATITGLSFPRKVRAKFTQCSEQSHNKPLHATRETRAREGQR